jgi:peptide/nickel transport system permease protein
MGVVQYVAKRVGLYLAVLFIGLTITFLLPRLMPANPIDGYIGQLQARASGALTRRRHRAAAGQAWSSLYGLKGDLFSQYLSLSRAGGAAFRFRAELHLLPAAGRLR